MDIRKIPAIFYLPAKPIGVLSTLQGVPNVFRRVTSNLIDVAPPFIFMYGVYSWANMTHVEMHRKKPEDFAHEQL